VVNQKLISAAIWIASLILVPLALTNGLEGNFLPLMVVGGLSFLLFVFFVLKDGSCVLPILGTFVIGKLNFLPFGLTATAIFTLGLIIYYFFGYFTLKQRSVSPGPVFLFLPILVITAIVAYHNRKIGLHAFGSSAEGSRPGLLMLLGAAGYICGTSISPPSASFLSRLPWYCVFVGVLTSLPDVITTFFPSLAPYFYYLTTQVNIGAYLEAEGFGSDVTRAGGLGGIGLYLEAALLAYYPIHTWWRPFRWWVPILFIFSLGGCVYGGYRSTVLLFGVVFLLGTWCYYTWRTLFILPVALLGILGLSLCVQNGMDLPLSVQRSLSFLPGKWDAAVMGSTESSNKFREDIKNVYIREELYKSPWLGNGFVFDTAQADMLDVLSRNDTTPDHYYLAKSFIFSKTFHVGWISLYDAIGLIGGGAFIALGLGMIGMAARFVWNQADVRASLFPLKVWLFCGITREFMGYFTVFGDVRDSFPVICAYAIILTQLDRVERAWNLKTIIPPVQQRKDIRNPGRIVPQPSLPSA
jgi:hypothetical protein